MSTWLRFLGAAGFEVAGPDTRVLIDPFLRGNPQAPVGPDELAAPDVILVSHAAADHLGDTAEIARRTGAPVVCGGDVRQLLLDVGLPPEQIMRAAWGIVVEVAGVVVRSVECHCESFVTRANGQLLAGMALAFIFDAEPGVRIYHYGDTSVFDMRLLGSLYTPTVGLIGCSPPGSHRAPMAGAGTQLTGRMNPAEAALVAEMLGVHTVVACHYDEPDENARRFVELVRGDGDGEPDGGDGEASGREAFAPRAGEWIALEPVPGEDTVA